MITDTRRDQIFEEMNGYILKLDPLASSPRYFIDKIAVCRNYLNSVSLVLSELQREKLVTSSELHKLQAILELESARLLSTDEQVRRLANIKDRESMVAHILRERRQRIDFLKDQLQAIDGIMKHVSLRNRELHATMDAIKNQRRFMHIEVQTGAFYGDERTPEHEGSVGMGTAGTSGDFSEDQLKALLASTEVDPAVNAALEEAAGVGQRPLLLSPAPTPVQEDPPNLDEPPAKIGVEAVDPAAQTPRQLTPAQLAEEGEAMRLFLGDPSPGEPSPSVPKEETDDLSFLLDSV